MLITGVMIDQPSCFFPEFYNSSRFRAKVRIAFQQLMLRDLSKSLTKQYKALKPSQSLTSSSSSKSRIDSQDSIPSKEGTNHKSCSHQGQDSSHQIQDSSHQGLGQDTSHQDTNCQNQDASHQWCSSWQSQAHPIWIVICSQCAKTRKEAKMQRVQEGDRL